MPECGGPQGLAAPQGPPGTLSPRAVGKPCSGQDMELWAISGGCPASWLAKKASVPSQQPSLGREHCELCSLFPPPRVSITSPRPAVRTGATKKGAGNCNAWWPWDPGRSLVLPLAWPAPLSSSASHPGGPVHALSVAGGHECKGQ